MSLHTVDVYQLANDWSVWAAGVVALCIFLLVLRLALRILPTFALVLDRTHRPKPKRVAAKRAAQVDIDWQQVTGLLDARRSRMESIGASRNRAAQSIEAAEYMLSGALAECAAVMQSAEARDQMRRRSVALSAKIGGQPTSASAAA